MEVSIKYIMLTFLSAIYYVNCASVSLKENNSDGFNSSGQIDVAATDLYVIREMIYEVGILTDDDNSSIPDESHEEVDLTFYDPEHNGSMIELSNIPVPISANISGHIITGIVPVNFGSVELPKSNITAPLYNPPIVHRIMPNSSVKVSNRTTNVSEHVLPTSLQLPQDFGVVPNF